MQRKVKWLDGQLEKDTAVIYVLDQDLRIVYCNETWDRFAAENGGYNLSRPQAFGMSILDVIPPPVKRFYETGYRQALSLGKVWRHFYECSSPVMYRKFQMQVHPNRKAAQLLVAHSLVVEWPHGPEREICGPSEALYADRNGIVTVCCECRRTCRTGQEFIWDWVPAYIERPPERISHGICDVCLNMCYLNRL